MAPTKLEKQQQAVLNAQKRLGVTLVNEEKKANKLRDARLIRLGVLAEQMFKGGDLQLLGRFESVALEQFKDRKFDRLAFELDEPLNWFDRVREEAMIENAQKSAASKGQSGAAASAASGPAPVGAKPAAGAAPRASTNGASSTSGASAPAASSSAASA